MFLTFPQLLSGIPSPVHSPIFLSSPIDIQYKYTLWLHITFVSTNNWFAQALAERTGIRRKAEILISFIQACVLYIIYDVKTVLWKHILLQICSFVHRLYKFNG
jgi:hypothetical protein